MRTTLLFLCGMSVLAQSGIQVPTIGTIVDASGGLRAVQGIAGNFSLGTVMFSGVLSTACSEQVCLAKTESQILSMRGAIDAPPGPAVFSLNGDEAVVYFPQSRIFAHWRDNTLEPLAWVAAWSLDGEILSIGQKKIAVRKNGKVSIVHPDGSVIDTIPDATGPVLLLSKGVVFGTTEEIVFRQGDSEVRLALTGADSIAAMGPHYVAIRAAGSIYALRIDPGREGLYLLPGSAP